MNRKKIYFFIAFFLFLILLKSSIIAEYLFLSLLGICIIALPLNIFLATILSFIEIFNPNAKLNSSTKFFYFLSIIGFLGIYLENIQTEFYINKEVYFFKLVMTILLSAIFYITIYNKKLFPKLPLIIMFFLIISSYFLKYKGII